MRKLRHGAQLGGHAAGRKGPGRLPSEPVRVPPKAPALLPHAGVPTDRRRGKAASREERRADVRTNVATCRQNRHLSSRR